MKRYLYDCIKKDLEIKMVFLTGPRQVGKTFLSKNLMPEFKNPIYLNNDDIDDIKIIRTRSWRLNTDLIILDEIHKMKNWKNYLKGTFDTRSENQTFLITGSARLDTFRQTGDSLAGRYFLYRLNPLSPKELSSNLKPYDAVSMLNKLGGFPEPFLSGSEEYSTRWREQYFTDIVREDILDFSRIHEIKTIKLLLEMLRKRVGSPISFSSIAQDLQVAPNTIKKYIDILESLNIVFIIRPYHKNIARAILKEPKVYFFDSGYVAGDEGIKLENTVAVCLLKYVHFMKDARGKNIELHYIKTKDGHEIDFALSEDGLLKNLIETKLSDEGVNRNLIYFKRKNPEICAIQLVHNLKHDIEKDGIEIVRAGEWLAKLDA